jgi:surface polysaccharide O-acyltransferase-like enzyme
MKSVQQPGKLYWADNLRVIAIFSVILVHVMDPLFENNPSVSPVWWIGNIYGSFVRYCVPIFVMLTGALILPKDYELKYFLKKKFIRNFFLFFFGVLFINS